MKGGKGNKDVAYAFINQALSPSAQAGLAVDLWYGPTNAKTKVPENVAKFMVHTVQQFDTAIQVDRLKLLEKRQSIIDKWNQTMTR